jgi:hypothetical protein
VRIDEWFALAVRIVGIVLLLIPGLGLLLDGLLLKLGYFNAPDTTPRYYVIYGTAQVVAGLYLIRGASLLVEFAYPTEDEDEADDSEKTEPDNSGKP